jgi:CheY-like chemotaxis protein
VFQYKGAVVLGAGLCGGLRKGSFPRTTVFCGGRLVVKILVADDNSNIQKMVGLALKDQGIDVVAVGNGEAAVRKISDVRPDLVLADVFMPVRNGYEVCKYVKDDSALSHIPVILLVGAFDPLDEQEAQRVGADGVLKKPFVPPDPLISMVKSALSRAGVALSSATAVKEEIPPLRGADLLTPQPKYAEPAAPAAFVEPEPFPEPVSKKAEPLTIDSSAQPLAFGNLLETPGTQEEEEPAYVTPVNSSLVPERSWGAEEAVEEQEEEAEEEHGNAWRPLGGGDELDNIPAGREDWREKAFGILENIQRKADKWASTEKNSDLTETVTAAPVASTASEVLASGPDIASPAHTEPHRAEGLPNAEPAEKETKTAVTAVEHTASLVTETPVAATPSSVELVTEDTAPAEPVPSQVSNSQVAERQTTSPSSTAWFSVPASPWEAEAQKATQLASTWDTEPEVSAATEVLPDPELVPNSQTAQPEPPTTAEPAYVMESTLPAETEEAIREETTQAVEEAVQEAAPANAATSDASATSPNLDDVVAKVLAKMSPDMLQAVTKEILKPVVEAIVRDELGKK